MSNRTNQYLLGDGTVADDTRMDGASLAEGVDPPSDPNWGEATLDDVFSVVFEIGRGQREAYLALTDLGCTTASDVAEAIGRDRSTANRNLNELYRKGVLTRRRRVLQSGGHVYEYSARPPDVVRALLRATLCEWILSAQARLDEFVDDRSKGQGPPERSTDRSRQ